MALTFSTGKTFANAEKITPTKLNDAVNGATVSGTLDIANGGTGASTADAARTALGVGTSDSPVFVALGAILRTPGHARTSADFSKTSDTTFADITGLSVTLAAGKTYGFRVVLFTSWGAAGGIKINLNGTATVTSLISDFQAWGDNTPLSHVQAAALNVTGVNQSGVAYAISKIIIEGTITVNAGGTFTVRSAQVNSDGTPATVKRGSTLNVWEIA